MYVSNFLMQQVKLCRDFYYRWKEGVLYLPVTAIDKSGRGLWSRGEKLYVDFCTMVSCFFREFYNSFLHSWIAPLVFELEVNEIKVVYMIRTFTFVMITLMIIVPLILFSFEKPKKYK